MKKIIGIISDCRLNVAKMWLLFFVISLLGVDSHSFAELLLASGIWSVCVVAVSIFIIGAYGHPGKSQ